VFPLSLYELSYIRLVMSTQIRENCREDNVAGSKERSTRLSVKHSFSRRLKDILFPRKFSRLLLSRDLDLELKHLDILDTCLRSIIICRTFSDVLI